MKSTEKPEQAHILKYLQENGWFVWRENSGKVPIRGHMYTMGKPGIADIMGVHKDGTGRIICLEVKDKRGYQNENQKRFENNIKSFNGIYGVVRNIEDVKKLLEIV